MEFLELAGSAYNRYDLGFVEEKRDLVRIVTSNRIVQGKSVELMLLEPFQVLANRPKTSYGAPYRDRPRTLMKKLLTWIEGNWRWGESSLDRFSFQSSQSNSEGKAGGIAA